MTPTEALDLFCKTALSYDGCNAQDQPLRFAALCARNGPVEAGRFFLLANLPGMPESSCCVASLGWLEETLNELGVHDLSYPLISAEDSWRRAVAFAKLHGAYFSPEHPGAGIRRGCIVNLQGIGRRHFWTCVGDEDGNVHRAVEGGSTNAAGFQAVRCRSHQLRGSAWDSTSGIPVADWIDAGMLLAALLAADVEPADASLGT